MSTTPLPLMSGVLATRQAATPMVMLTVHPAARVRGTEGMDRRSLVVRLVPNTIEMLKLFENIAAPVVLLTAFTEAVPTKVSAVAFTVKLAEMVAVTLSKVTGVVKLMVI